MNFLEQRILDDGIVKPGNVLKVDSFLNHQMDIALMEQSGEEFHRRFAHKKITKVLTIEASGIGIAYPVAKQFGVPMVFAKKSKSVNIDEFSKRYDFNMSMSDNLKKFKEDGYNISRASAYRYLDELKEKMSHYSIEIEEDYINCYNETSITTEIKE